MATPKKPTTEKTLKSPTLQKDQPIKGTVLPMGTADASSTDASKAVDNTLAANQHE